MAANDQLNFDLEAAVKRGVIVSFDSSNPTGNKLVWDLKLSDAAGAVIGEFDASAMETKEAKAFVAGLAAGATGGKVRQPRQLKANPYRDAIRTDGRVEYKVADPGDQVAMKKARNMLFSLAYSLGHKGAFKVTTHEGGVLIGEVVKAKAS